MSETEKGEITRRDFLKLSGKTLLTLGVAPIWPNSESPPETQVLALEPEKATRFSSWPMDGDPEKMIGDGINPPLGYRHLQETVDVKMNPDGGHHIGVDFNLGDKDDDLGAPLNMIMDGVCVYAGDGGGRNLGKIAIFCSKLTDGNLVYPRYAHMLEWNVTPGQTYKAGEVVGKCGKSGWENGNAHLHLDIGTRAVFENHYTGIFADAWWYPHKAPVWYIEKYYLDPVELIKSLIPSKEESDKARIIDNLTGLREILAQRKFFRYRPR